RTAETIGAGRYRVRRGQHHGGPRGPPASAPHRGRDAERRRELSGARRHLRRRAAPLRRRARDRRAPREVPNPRPEIVMSEKIDINHLRQWIGHTEEKTDIVTAHLVKGLRATLFQEIGEPTAGDAAPLTAHWCLALAV